MLSHWFGVVVVVVVIVLLVVWSSRPDQDFACERKKITTNQNSSFNQIGTVTSCFLNILLLCRLIILWFRNARLVQPGMETRAHIQSCVLH